MYSLNTHPLAKGGYIKVLPICIHSPNEWILEYCSNYGTSYKCWTQENGEIGFTCNNEATNPNIHTMTLYKALQFGCVCMGVDTFIKVGGGGAW